VGAGNFDTTYFRERRTTEDVRQAHSIEMQTLGELGLVGIALLAAFLGAVLWGFGRKVAAARADSRSRWAAVAAGGVFITWLVHTSVDWLHLLPGVTGIAICAAAALVAPWRAPRSGAGRTRLVIAGLAVAVTILGAVVVGRSVLADYYLAEGRAKLTKDPAGALRDAEASLDVDDEVLKAHYLKSAAYARLGSYEDAKAALEEAARREPSDFLPWALLGDLATRRRDDAARRRFYARAAELNPRDRAIRALARR
jgi:O-antigen ligase